MHLEEIDRIIEEYEKYNLIFSDASLKKIRDGCESWKNDWVIVFKKQLRRIKKEEGSPARDRENGIRVTYPLVKNQYMAIFYKKQTNGSYYIYNFKLGIMEI